MSTATEGTPTATEHAEAPPHVSAFKRDINKADLDIAKTLVKLSQGVQPPQEQRHVSVQLPEHYSRNQNPFLPSLGKPPTDSAGSQESAHEQTIPLEEALESLVGPEEPMQESQEHRTNPQEAMEPPQSTIQPQPFDNVSTSLMPLSGQFPHLNPGMVLNGQAFAAASALIPDRVKALLGSTLALKQLNMHQQMEAQLLYEESKTGRNTDMQLYCDGYVFHCHSDLISMISPTFNRTISKNLPNTIHCLPGMRPEDIRRIMVYLYLGQLSVPFEDQNSFLDATEYFEIRLGYAWEMWLRVQLLFRARAIIAQRPVNHIDSEPEEEEINVCDLMPSPSDEEISKAPENQAEGSSSRRRLRKNPSPKKRPRTTSMGSSINPESGSSTEASPSYNPNHAMTAPVFPQKPLPFPAGLPQVPSAASFQEILLRASNVSPPYSGLNSSVPVNLHNMAGVAFPQVPLSFPASLPQFPSVSYQQASLPETKNVSPLSKQYQHETVAMMANQMNAANQMQGLSLNDLESPELPRSRPGRRSRTERNFVRDENGEVVRGLNNKPQTICKICQKVLADPSSMYRHMKTHTGEKPHKCPFCFRFFIQRYNMKQHLKTHRNKVDPAMVATLPEDLQQALQKDGRIV